MSDEDSQPEYYKPFSNGVWDGIMEIVIYIQYGSPLLWVVGLPIYLFCTFIFFLNNIIRDIVTFF